MRFNFIRRAATPPRLSDRPTFFRTLCERYRRSRGERADRLEIPEERVNEILGALGVLRVKEAPTDGERTVDSCEHWIAAFENIV